jgi:hypothetical protein
MSAYSATRTKPAAAKRQIKPLVPTPQAGPDPEFSYSHPLQRGWNPPASHPVLRGRGVDQNTHGGGIHDVSGLKWFKGDTP